MKLLVVSHACVTNTNQAFYAESGEIPVLIGATGGGEIAPEGDVQAWVIALRRLLLDPVHRTNLARKGRQRVCERYGQEVLASRFVETVESAVAQSGDSPRASVKVGGV